LKKHLALSAAVLAMLLTALAVHGPLRAEAQTPNLSAAPEQVQPALGLEAIVSAPFRVLEEARRPEVLDQVRIEQRVIIRISPTPPEARQRLQALQPRRSARFRETDHDDCVRVSNIIGAQPTNDNRLLLFMENRNVLAASLERGCTASAFYSGFYLERSGDGRLCIARDRLQSRAGVSCSLRNITRLLPPAD
jgi:hypothetical protein